MFPAGGGIGGRIDWRCHQHEGRWRGRFDRLREMRGGEKFGPGRSALVVNAAASSKHVHNAPKGYRTSRPAEQFPDVCHRLGYTEKLSSARSAKSIGSGNGFLRPCWRCCRCRSSRSSSQGRYLKIIGEGLPRGRVTATLLRCDAMFRAVFVDHAGVDGSACSSIASRPGLDVTRFEQDFDGIAVDRGVPTLSSSIGCFGVTIAACR
jgi:hypothetical protein